MQNISNNENVKINRNKGQQWLSVFFILIVTALFISPLLPRIRLGAVPVQARVGSVPLGVHHFIYLVIITSFLLALIPVIRVKRKQLYYIGFSVALTISLILAGLPKPDTRTALGHMSVVATASAVGLLVTTDSEISPSYVVYSAYLGGTVVALWDLIVFFSPANFAGSSSSLIPFIQSGGYAPPVSAGTHGIVVGIGVVAGLHFLKVGWEQSKARRVIVPTSIIAMVFVILLSNSRSSVIALLLGISLFYIDFSRPFRRRTFVFFSTFVAPLLIGIGVFIASLRSRTVFQRVEQNLAALDLTFSHPLTGVGWQNIFPNYLSHVIHNTPLNYFASSGLVVGLVFLLVYLYPLFTGVRGLLNKTGNQDYTRVFLSMWVIVATELILYKSTPNIYLFLIGMMVCIAAVGNQNKCLKVISSVD